MQVHKTYYRQIELDLFSVRAYHFFSIIIIIIIADFHNYVIFDDIFILFSICGLLTRRDRFYRLLIFS